MASKSPTARTLEHCRKLGWPASVVERYIAATRRRHDALGFGDVLAAARYPLLIQACSMGDMSKRTKKIIEERFDEASAWLAAGGRIEVWGWAKRGKQGKRKLWTLRRVKIRRGYRPEDEHGGYPFAWILKSEVIE